MLLAKKASARRACDPRPIFFLVLIFWCIAVCAQTAPSVKVDEAEARLTFVGDQMVFEFPLTGVSPTARAMISAEVLDFDDHAISQVGSQPCVLENRRTLCRATLPPVDGALARTFGENMPLLRVKYRIDGVNGGLSGTLSWGQIAPELVETHIAGPKVIRPGESYVVRLRVVHPVTGKPRAHMPLTAVFKSRYQTGDDEDNRYTYQDDDDGAEELTHTSLVSDGNGFATVRFTAPKRSDLLAVYLEVQSKTGNLSGSVKQSFYVPGREQMQLTTDKPIYQPGQTLHVRVLMLDRSGHARADEKVKLTVLDPNSTDMFMADSVTSRFGVASLDWPIPARALLGDYELRAESKHAGYKEAEVRISRYDLPTFTVEPKADRTFYLPGKDASIAVRAQYLFGKPVLHGHARVVRDVERTWNFRSQRYETKEGDVVEGDLNAEGEFVAHIDLKKDADQFKETSAPLFANVKLAVYVTDGSSGRTEQRRLDLRLAAEPLQIYTFDEPSVIENMPRRTYIAVARADGTPMESDVEIGLLSHDPADRGEMGRLIPAGRMLRHIHTNARGLARVDLRSAEELTKLAPPDAASAARKASSGHGPALYFTARNVAGETGHFARKLDTGEAALRVRTDKSIYQPGEEIQVSIESPEPSLPVTLQLFRRTRDMPVLLESHNVTLSHGRTTVGIASDERFRGIVLLTAVVLRPVAGEVHDGMNVQGPVVTANGAVLFPQDSRLKVDIHMNRTEYRPGEEAVARLTVHGPDDPDGDGMETVPSDLGVAVVDRAVAERNRTDQEFGDRRTTPFFFERETDFSEMAGGLTLDQLEQIEPGKTLPAGGNLAAEMLLAVLANRFPMNVNGNAPGTDYDSIFARVLALQLNPLTSALAQYLKVHLEIPTGEPELAALVSPWHVDLLALRDPWGMPYRLKEIRLSYGRDELFLVSSGPDKQPDTVDDFSRLIASWEWFSRRGTLLERAVLDYHTRTGGFIRNIDDLRDEMRRVGEIIDVWRDPWGQPFRFEFTIQRDAYLVSAVSRGDPDDSNGTETGFHVGSVSINYFKERGEQIETALQAYTAEHGFPSNDEQFNEALRARNVAPEVLIDPWGHRLYAIFSQQNIFTDSARTETYTREGETPRNRTTITPVTEMIDTFLLRSCGPDGEPSEDDVTLLRLLHVRSQQSATDAKAVLPAVASVGTPDTGMLRGTVTDQTGAVIVGVSVAADDVVTGREYTAKTNEDGEYILAGIPAGRYKLHLSSPGFMDFVYDDVRVIAQTGTSLDAVLRVGSVATEVAVLASTVALQTDDAMVATVAERKTVLGPSASGKAVSMSTPRLREYFPETMLWRPEVITSADGSATLRFPVADSITTWTLSAAASTEKGNLGGATTQFRSFQPFFAAFDPPSVLTVGDTVSLPVALHNYLNHPISVHSSLAPAPWFKVNGPAKLTTQLASQDSASPVFRFTVLKATNGQQQFVAKAAETGDRVARPMRVHPDGMEASVTAAGVVGAGDTDLSVTIPTDAMADGHDAMLKLYPNLAAHMQDALSTMARYPDGCAEQIISIAWPSLLLQRYAAALPRPDEKMQEKTKRQLEEAYQNLLGNQLPDGGFAYWRWNSLADAALTAYAVQFLTQASQFITVDGNVIDHAVAYLARTQQADGRWFVVDWRGTSHPEDRRGNAMLTLSIAAMVAGVPKANPLIIKALDGTRDFVEEFDEPYTIAASALAALQVKNSERSDAALARLRSMALRENDGAYWSLETNTVFYGAGHAGRIETTAMVLHALLASGAGPDDDLVGRGLIFLQREQDRYGLWYSTQASARVLDVLSEIALHNSSGVGSGKPSTATVLVDGQPVSTVNLPQATKEAGPVFIPLGAALGPGQHHVTLRLPAGAATMTTQLVADFYRPWSTVTVGGTVVNHERLQMAVHYSATAAAPNTDVEASAHVERAGFEGYGMMMAEIGLPPGADVDRASLESAMASSDYQLNHYDVLPDKVMLYLWPHAGGIDVRFRFKLRYGVDALTSASTVYDYYNPDARADVAPVRFTTP